jgi:hypothetical protein
MTIAYTICSREEGVLKTIPVFVNTVSHFLEFGKVMWPGAAGWLAGCRVIHILTCNA